MMNHVQSFEQYINEAVYNLEWPTDKYVRAFYEKIKNIKGVEDTDSPRFVVYDYSSDVDIHLQGQNPNIIEDLQKALKDFDKNLDLTSITTNYDAGDDDRSQNDKEHNVWKIRIPKKKDYHFFKDVNAPSGETRMSQEIVSNLINMLGQYTSDGAELADQEWRSLKDFMSSASDTMSKANFVKYSKTAYKKYPYVK
jgi:hypothetical protein